MLNSLFGTKTDVIQSKPLSHIANNVQVKFSKYNKHLQKTFPIRMRIFFVRFECFICLKKTKITVRCVKLIKQRQTNISLKWMLYLILKYDCSAHIKCSIKKKKSSKSTWELLLLAINSIENNWRSLCGQPKSNKNLFENMELKGQ